MARRPWLLRYTEVFLQSNRLFLTAKAPRAHRSYIENNEPTIVTYVSMWFSFQVGLIQDPFNAGDIMDSESSSE